MTCEQMRVYLAARIAAPPWVRLQVSSEAAGRRYRISLAAPVGQPYFVLLFVSGVGPLTARLEAMIAREIEDGVHRIVCAAIGYRR